MPSTSVRPQNRCRTSTSAKADPEDRVDHRRQGRDPQRHAERPLRPRARPERLEERPQARRRTTCRTRASVGTRIRTANQPSTAPISSQRPTARCGRPARPPRGGRARLGRSDDQWPWSTPHRRWSRFKTIRISSEQASRTAETTSAPWRLPLSISPKMYSGAGLGRERAVAGDHHHAAELAQGPAERQRRAGQDRRPERRQRDPAERRPGPGPERRRGLFLGPVQLQQHRLHAPDHERIGHEQAAPARSPAAGRSRPSRTGPGSSRARSTARRGPPASRRDDRRHGERQVDQGVDQALARELVADQDPGGRRARHRVDQRPSPGRSRRSASARARRKGRTAPPRTRRARAGPPATPSATSGRTTIDARGRTGSSTAGPGPDAAAVRLRSRADGHRALISPCAWDRSAAIDGPEPLGAVELLLDLGPAAEVGHREELRRATAAPAPAA